MRALAMAGGDGGAIFVCTGAGLPGMAMISVRDSGPGISPDVAERLFEPFVSTKGVQGMGVGLSICRTIVEGHGGKIWVEPADGSSTVFRFTLPLSAPGADVEKMVPLRIKGGAI